jgi:hypothetical protein
VACATHITLCIYNQHQPTTSVLSHPYHPLPIITSTRTPLTVLSHPDLLCLSLSLPISAQFQPLTSRKQPQGRFCQKGTRQFQYLSAIADRFKTGLANRQPPGSLPDAPSSTRIGLGQIFEQEADWRGSCSKFETCWSRFTGVRGMVGRGKSPSVLPCLQLRTSSRKL